MQGPGYRSKQGRDLWLNMDKYFGTLRGFSDHTDSAIPGIPSKCGLLTHSHTSFKSVNQRSCCYHNN